MVKFTVVFGRILYYVKYSQNYAFFALLSRDSTRRTEKQGYGIFFSEGITAVMCIKLGNFFDFLISRRKSERDAKNHVAFKNVSRRSKKLGETTKLQKG